MDMTNWKKMLNGDMSGLKTNIEKPKIPEGPVYRIYWKNGQRTNLINYNKAVRCVNEWINRVGWEWIKIINEQTNERQIVYEPKTRNRVFLQIRGLNKNMLEVKNKKAAKGKNQSVSTIKEKSNAKQKK